jgi:hypothetical protein
MRLMDRLLPVAEDRDQHANAEQRPAAVAGFARIQSGTVAEFVRIQFFDWAGR